MKRWSFHGGGEGGTIYKFGKDSFSTFIILLWLALFYRLNIVFRYFQRNQKDKDQNDRKRNQAKKIASESLRLKRWWLSINTALQI